MRVLGVSRGNVRMILEVANLNIRPGESADFERAFAEARALIAALPGYGWGRSVDGESDKRMCAPQYPVRRQIMNHAARSIVVWGIYTMVAGLCLVLIPNIILPPFGYPVATEVWVRAFGLLVTILGAYYFYLGRNNCVMFFRITIPGRFVLALGLTVFVLLGWSVPALIFIGLVDAGGALWTWWALRRDASGNVNSAHGRA
jgi:hypothetical protein